MTILFTVQEMYTFKYNIELIFDNTSIIEYWFFSHVEYFMPRIAPPVSILLLHVIVVKNGGCNTSHSKQAFYTKYTGK
jgi:hypothetical protein